MMVVVCSNTQNLEEKKGGIGLEAGGRVRNEHIAACGLNLW